MPRCESSASDSSYLLFWKILIIFCYRHLNGRCQSVSRRGCRESLRNRCCDCLGMIVFHDRNCCCCDYPEMNLYHGWSYCCFDFLGTSLHHGWNRCFDFLGTSLHHGWNRCFGDCFCYYLLSLVWNCGHNCLDSHHDPSHSAFRSADREVCWDGSGRGVPRRNCDH